MMEQSVFPAVKLLGSVAVPGQAEAAAEALVLAAVATGPGRVAKAPAVLDPALAALRRLGVPIRKDKGALHVDGVGLRGLQVADAPLDAQMPTGATLLLAALLAGQAFATRLKVGPWRDACLGLAAHLKAAGAAVHEEAPGILCLGGGTALQGVEHDTSEVDAETRQALLLVGLLAEGTTVLRGAAKSRDGAERPLRQRSVDIGRDGARTLSVNGGQEVAPIEVEAPGDLNLALPLVVAASCLKGSDLRLEGLAIKAGRRAFLDLMRQVGADLQVDENADGSCDLTVAHAKLKGTRIAGARMEKVKDHLALLAVLATQIEGEVVLRDVEDLRRGPFDLVSHLVETLRRMEVRVGEFPEGLVVKGGQRLKAGRYDAREDARLGLALGVAGLFATGETVLEGVEAAAAAYPGFFEQLETLKEKKR